jgi:hypothetical protein
MAAFLHPTHMRSVLLDYTQQAVEKYLPGLIWSNVTPRNTGIFNIC